MQQPRVHAGIFIYDDLGKLKIDFQKKFILVQAAGGLVKNETDKILMIFRRGKWDLPKGNVDENEKIEDCALREVKEETGLKDVQLNSPLTITYHTYHEGTKYILKESHWFTMMAVGEQELIPQVEEDILEIKWIEQKDLHLYLPKSFLLISDIIKSARQKGFISF